MLPPVIRMNTDAAADAGSPAMPGQGESAAGENPFSSLLAVAPPPGDAGVAGGTGLPPGGNAVPAGSAPLPAAGLAPVTIDAALAAQPAESARASAAADEASPAPALPVAATGLAALERMLPAPAAGAADIGVSPGAGAGAAPATGATVTLRASEGGSRRRAPALPAVPAGVAAVPAAPQAPASESLRPAVPLPVDPAVRIRDTAGRSAFALGDALQAAVSRGPLGPEPAAGVEWLRADPDPAALRTALPLAAGGQTVATPGASTPPATTIPLPVADSGWGDALAERVLLLAGQRMQSAEIRLNPAELGPLKVEIRLEDGALQVNLTAQHAVTRDAIEQALPRLRELFAGEGLSLSGASVSEQGLRHERDGRAADDARAAATADAGPADEEAVEMPLPQRQGGRGLVDTFA